ncbi:MFS general substrate transporter [Penicillium nucicola]|uniref:MFS general substrate transporter n=1 Tax=Penicillium nucicola TaxID=1850975 RepID=UPI0025458DA1|nr:MFS general substrate transporter [Penicillium nucicola]KAJ5751541.1 MFS general substrate transporter [Penicillium nucicola]
MTRQKEYPMMQPHSPQIDAPSSPNSATSSTINSLTSEKTLVSFTPVADIQPEACASSAHSARHWAVSRKVAVSLGAITCFLVVTLTTSIYIASIPGIMAEFQVGRTLAILPVTLYALGFAIGPMCTSALSEEFGRQYVYKISLLLHFAFTLWGGFARNFCTIAVCRAISGLVGSPSVSVFAGVLNDLWQMPEDRLGVPLFVLYGLGGAAAPEIGPVIGEAVVAVYGWRSSFWLTAILVGACILGMICVPETFEPEILRKKLKLPRRDPRKALAPAFLRPIHLLWAEPIVLPTAAIVTMSQIVIFILYAGYPVILERTYQFSPYQVGLAFLPILVGTLLAAPVLSMVDRRKRRLNRSVPEDNLPGAMLAAILLPISLLWLAWTARPMVHWICPLLAGIPYGLGFALSQLSYPLYKNEVYGAELGASAIAVDVAMRYLFSSVFPLFTIDLIDSIGFDWTMTACAVVMMVLTPVPWLLQKFGAQLRSRSRYAKKVPIMTGQQNESREATRGDDGTVFSAPYSPV